MAWTVWVLLAALGGCAASSVTATRMPPDVTPRAPGGPAPSVQRGQASWYGEPHHGRKTASGEAYDMHALTAAHRTLPLGTRLLVTNLNNGKTVEVRVNDRGPVVAARIVDLSYAAARALGAIGAGVIPVNLRVLPASEDASGRARDPTGDAASRPPDR